MFTLNLINAEREEWILIKYLIYLFIYMRYYIIILFQFFNLME